MGRKRKLGLESKGNLPPCRVCDAPGAGFHYGANTCEACKGFFHRSLKMSGQYRCDGDGNCAIEHGHNRLCQFCRYQKCLAVGMAKEAIKTGRYTSVKRTNDILEIKRLQETKKHEPPSPPGNSLHQELLYLPLKSCDSNNENSLDCDSQSGKCSILSGNSIRQISSPSVAQIKSQDPDSFFLNKNSSLVGEMCQRACISMSGQTLQETESQNPACTKVPRLVNTDSPDATNLQDIESLLSESPHSNGTFQEAHPQQQFQALSSAKSPSSITSPLGSPSDGCTTRPLPSLLADAASLISLSSTAVYTFDHSPSSSYTTSASLQSPSSLTSVNSPAVLLLSPGSLSTSPAAYGGSSSLSLSHLDMQMYMSDSPNSTCDTGSDVTISELYQDKDNVIQLLIEADESFVVPLCSKMSEEEIKKQQNEHFEACRLQREMFGQLRRLPDHEYDYIFVTTGLDTDDRQKRLRILGAGLEKMIRAMVKFCKNIPGFSRLDICDKVKLIKYSRQEFYLFTIYKFMNAEKKIIRGLDNQWKCEYEMSRLSTDDDMSIFSESLNLHFKFCTSLQNLKLSEEELVIIRAIIVMAPDRDPHVESTLAREIHWELNECLIHLLSRNHPNPMPVYARIMGKLTEARSQTNNMIQFFRRLKIDKYSNVMDNPLLREMCSGIFFDEKDEECISFVG